MKLWKLNGEVGPVLLYAVLSLILLASWSGAAGQAVESAQVRGYMAWGPASWDAHDFGWFYYEPDDDSGGERLDVYPMGRMVPEGGLLYSSSVWSQEYNHEDWGRFRAVAFMGKPYFVGYPNSTFTDEVDTLDEGDMRVVLLDVDSEVTFNTSLPLALAEGFILALQDVSDDGQDVYLTLYQGKAAVDHAVVRSGETYSYKVGDDEIPIILVHVQSAMKGRDESLCQVDGVFQVEETPSVHLSDGQHLEKLVLSEFSSDGMVFKSSEDISLSPDRMILLAGKLFLRVIDDLSLLYYPVGVYDEYGFHAIRGPVVEGDSPWPSRFADASAMAQAEWTSLNTPCLYFDDDQKIGKETIFMNGSEGRIIPWAYFVPGESGLDVNGIFYYSLPQWREFERKEWGAYDVVSLFGQLWFAGYGRYTSQEIGQASPLDYEELIPILIDTDRRDIAGKGDIFRLQGGYTLFVQDVGKERAFFSIYKDGRWVDNSTISSNSTYVYKEDVRDIPDLPILVIHVGAIFEDLSRNFAEIDGLFQISDQIYLPMESGMEFDKMVLLQADHGIILMGNHEVIDLKRDSIITLWPEIAGLWKAMNIRVADNDTLRYFPYTVEYVVPPPQIVQLSATKEVTPPTLANFSMLIQGAEIEGVLAEVVDPYGRKVSSMDITSTGVGSGDHWSYQWSWVPTVSVLSDDGTLVPDLNWVLPSAILYQPDSYPLEVGVKFDSSGRIAGITDLAGEIYYISPSEYARSGLDYATMLGNRTLREELIKIVPNQSILGFITYVNGTAVSQSNHTLQGSLEALEPQLIRLPAPPGEYGLAIKMANVITSRAEGGFPIKVLAQPSEPNAIDQPLSDDEQAADESGGKSRDETATKRSPGAGLLAALLAFFASERLRR